MLFLIFNIPDLSTVELVIIRSAAIVALVLGLGRLLFFEVISFLHGVHSATTKIRVGNKSVELNLDDEASVRHGIEELSEGFDEPKEKL